MIFLHYICVFKKSVNFFPLMFIPPTLLQTFLQRISAPPDIFFLNKYSAFGENINCNVLYKVNCQLFTGLPAKLQVRDYFLRKLLKTLDWDVNLRWGVQHCVTFIQFCRVFDYELWLLDRVFTIQCGIIIIICHIFKEYEMRCSHGEKSTELTWKFWMFAASKTIEWSTINLASNVI